MTGWRRHSVALGLYALLTLLFTYPLPLHLTTHVIGAMRADNFEFLWKMWWVPHAPFDLGTSPWTAPHLYYPYGYSLAYGEITPLHTFLLMPLTRLLGETVTYNLAILGSTILTGWSGYWLARRWLARLAPDADAALRFLAALYAGAALAFSVARLLKLHGHLNILETHLLVFALMAFDAWLDRRQPGRALVLALLIGLAALSTWYYALMLLVVLPVYGLARGGIPALLRDRRSYLGAALVVALVAGICLPFLLPYLRLSAEGVTRATLEDATFWSASPTDYLLPNAYHPLWGRAIARVAWPFPTPMISEFVTPVGWVTLLLGLWAWGRATGPRWRALKWAVGAAFVFSLGPYLTLSRLPLGVPLPVLLLRDLLPLAESIRTWGRFSQFVMIGASLLAGAGLTLGLRELSRRRRRLAAFSAIALMLFESWIGPMPMQPVGPRPVDLWLAAQPGGRPIMQYPLSEALSGAGMYYTRFHGRPAVFASATYFPAVYRERHPELSLFPDDAALDLLAEWGVEYVLVTVTLLGGEPYAVADIEAQPRLRRVSEQDGVIVYALSG